MPIELEDGPNSRPEAFGVVDGRRVRAVLPLVDDGAGNLVPQPGPAVASGSLTDRSGSIIEGGAAQQVAAANAARRYFFICNTSTETLRVNFGADASDGNSFPLAAAPGVGEPGGGTLTFEGSFIPSEAVSILGATTGSTFVAKEG